MAFLRPVNAQPPTGIDRHEVGGMIRARKCYEFQVKDKRIDDLTVTNTGTKITVLISRQKKGDFYVNDVSTTL